MAKIGVDFDGCCVVALPEPGICNYDTGAAKVLQDLIKEGHNIILWTCRNHDKSNPYNWINGKLRKTTSLEEALEWFSENNIELSGINYVPNEEELIGKTRKILIDVLIDDTSLGSRLKVCNVTYKKLKDKKKETIQTYCIDWDWARHELEELGLLKRKRRT